MEGEKGASCADAINDAEGSQSRFTLSLQELDRERSKSYWAINHDELRIYDSAPPK